MLYTIIVVVTVGLTLYEVYFTKDASAELLQDMRAQRVLFARLLFVLVLCSIFEQAIMWLDRFGPDRFDVGQLFFESLTGQIWVAIFVLSLVGLFIQRLSSTYLVIWSLLIVAAESMNGHIAMLDSYAIVIDFIHLLCAAIWAGGIASFILNWKKSKEQLLQQMQSFMQVIWITVIVMSISGLLLAILILPDYLYLLYSSWGQWLLVKVVLVALALWGGHKVRQHVKKQELPLPRALRLEAIALLTVLAIAGVLTILSPEPKPNSLDYHKMGDELHYTVELTPNRPGSNTLSLKLWTLEEDGAIASVVVELTDIEKGERTSRNLELTKVELEEPYDFMGFVESRYKYAEELRLPYPSKWQKKVDITFTSGEVRTFTFSFNN